MNPTGLVDLLAAHRGPLFHGRLSLATWETLRPDLTACEWLGVLLTDRTCTAVEVVVIATGRPRGSTLEKIGPQRAADLARLWLAFRQRRELQASAEWSEILGLPGPNRRPPAAALQRRSA